MSRNGSSTMTVRLREKDPGRIDDVGNAGFVFEREEHEPFAYTGR